MEGAESILKKRSVRLCILISTYEKLFKKLGYNSDHKNDPTPERPLSCTLNALHHQKALIPQGIAPSALHYPNPFAYTRF